MTNHGRWVVTAAHCVHGLSDKEADDVWVRVGDHDNSDPGDTQVEHQHRMSREFLNFGIDKLILPLSLRLRL